MRLWLCARGEACLVVWMGVWSDRMWVQQVVWSMCCGKGWGIGRLVVSICSCVSVLWMVLACMRRMSVRCGFVHSVWRCLRVPSVGVVPGRQ